MMPDVGLVISSIPLTLLIVTVLQFDVGGVVGDPPPEHVLELVALATRGATSMPANTSPGRLATRISFLNVMFSLQKEPSLPLPGDRPRFNARELPSLKPAWRAYGHGGPTAIGQMSPVSPSQSSRAGTGRISRSAAPGQATSRRSVALALSRMPAAQLCQAAIPTAV